MSLELIEYTFLAVAALIGVWSAIGTLSTRGIETPRYRVTKKMNGYEIREYESYLVAETTVNGTYKESQSRGFRALADYIFGNNVRVRSGQLQTISSEDNIGTRSFEDSERIAMTAPVVSERNTQEVRRNEYRISFAMPSRYTMDTLPVPRNQEILIHEVKKHLSAVLTFSGYTSEKRILAKRQKLRELLSRDNIKATPGYRVAQFDPPWTPPYMRHNEIVIDMREFEEPRRS